MRCARANRPSRDPLQCGQSRGYGLQAVADGKRKRKTPSQKRGKVLGELSADRGQAGKKSIGLVVVIVSTSRASKRNIFTRLTSLRSRSGSERSEETTSHMLMAPVGSIVNLSTSLPCSAGFFRSARL